jgi:hypothetical protein
MVAVFSAGSQPLRSTAFLGRETMADMDTPKQKPQEKKEEKRGGIPTLKDTTQTLRNPAFKIRDLTARTVVDRFKQFRKKDLAFIMAGLGVLFAAPMAEHYLMSPTHGSSDVFKEGWGFRPGVGGLGAGGSPFDTGETGFSPGNQVGDNGDIITPANFRDPSSLILGPEAEAQAPATTSSEPSSGNSGAGSNWKNALAEAGTGAGKAALGRAGLPMPPMTLSKNMLSGLSGGGGGTHASYSASGISGGNVPSRPNVSNSLGAVKAAPGFQGVARSLTGTGAGSPESLKSAGANAASNFAASNASKGLENAAAVQMPTANTSGNGAGSADKGSGQNSAKQGKTLGESLAFMAAKENMMKGIDLQWKLAEKNAMMWPNIEEKVMTDMIQKPIDAAADTIGGALAGLTGGPSSGQYTCAEGSFSNVLPCDPNTTTSKASLLCTDGLGNVYEQQGKGLPPKEVGTKCGKNEGGGAPPPPPPGEPLTQAVSSIGTSLATCNAGTTNTTVNGQSATAADPNLDQKKAICADLKKAQDAAAAAQTTMGPDPAPPAAAATYNYNEDSVRGIAFNPMTSLLWLAMSHFHASPAWAQGDASPSNESDPAASGENGASIISHLTSAYGSLNDEIANLQAELKLISDYKTANNPAIKMVSSDVAIPDYENAVTNLHSLEAPASDEYSKYKQLDKQFKKYGSKFTNDIGQITAPRASVKGNETIIQNSESDATSMSNQINPNNSAAYKDYAKKIGQLYTNVQSKRRSLDLCEKNEESVSDALFNLQTEIMVNQKAFHDAFGSSDTQELGLSALLNNAIGGNGESDQTLYADAQAFEKQFPPIWKRAEKIQKAIHDIRVDIQGLNCPSSVKVMAPASTLNASSS